MGAIILLCIIGGLVVCFAGYKLLHAVLGLSGALGLGILVASFGNAHLHDPTMTVVMSLVAAAIGWILAMAVYKVGVFCGGAFAGYFVPFYFSSGHPNATTALILAVGCGIVATVWEKALVAVATAFVGALYAITGLALYLHVTHVSGRPTFVAVTSASHAATHHAGWFIVWILLGATGSLRQLGRWKWPLLKMPQGRWPLWQGAAKATGQPEGPGGLATTQSDEIERLRRLAANPFFSARLSMFRLVHLARAQSEVSPGPSRFENLAKALGEFAIGPRRKDLQEVKDVVAFYRSAEKRLHELQKGPRFTGSLSNQDYWIGLLAIADAAEPIGHQTILRTLRNHAVHIHSLDKSYEWLASSEGRRWIALNRTGTGPGTFLSVLNELNREPDPLSQCFFKGRVVEQDYLREAIEAVAPQRQQAAAPGPPLERPSGRRL